MRVNVYRERLGLRNPGENPVSPAKPGPLFSTPNNGWDLFAHPPCSLKSTHPEKREAVRGWAEICDSGLLSFSLSAAQGLQAPMPPTDDRDLQAQSPAGRDL